MVKRSLLILIFLFMLAYFGYSKEPEVTVSISSSEVSVNESFQVTIEISGEANASLSTDFDSFDPHIILNYSGRSSSYVMDFSGTTSATTTYTLTGIITKEGDYTIGPFTITVGSKKYKTESATIKVIKGSKSNHTTNTTNIKSNVYSNAGNGMYLIYLNTSKTTVYENEYFDISVDFYVADDFQFRNYKALKLPDIAWIENLEDKNKRANKVALNGRYYYHYQVEKKRIYIPKAGEYDIKPATINFDGYDPNSFFFSAKPYSLQTKSKHIKVLPLPKNTTGIPTDIVGHFTFKSKISSEKITTQDSATLKIELSGEGNFQNIDNLSYTVDSALESYTPKSNIITKNKLHKTKVWEILLIPNKVGTYNVTVNDFCYFDIVKKKYIVLKGKKFSLTVKKGVVKNKDGSITILNDIDNVTDTETYTSIGYIKLSKGRKNFNVYRNSLIVVVALYSLLILSLLILVLMKFIYYFRLQNSSVLAKNTAFRKLQKELNSFEKKTRQKNININEIVAGLSKSIEKYFINKFTMDSIEFTTTNIEPLLNKLVKHEYLQQVKDIMIQLDMVRFGGIDIDTKKLKELINRINSVIKKIDLAG